MILPPAQKFAFDKLFNALKYHHNSKDGWVTAKMIDSHPNTLKALIKLGLVEHQIRASWCENNINWYRLKEEQNEKRKTLH